MQVLNVCLLFINTTQPCGKVPIKSLEGDAFLVSVGLITFLHATRLIKYAAQGLIDIRAHTVNKPLCHFYTVLIYQLACCCLTQSLEEQEGRKDVPYYRML